MMLPIETLLQPIFFVYILLFFLQIAAILSSKRLASTIACTIFLILLVIFLSTLPLGDSSLILKTNLLAIIAFTTTALLFLNLEKLNLKVIWFPLLMALISGLFIGSQPNPFEYPGDISTYLNQFIHLSLDTTPQANCFSNNLIPKTYNSSCTVVKTLLSIGNINIQSLINGMAQRAFLGLEVSIMALSYYRLLLSLGLNRISIILSWILLLFGIGNQSILLVLNHGLQGSILAAALFMEIATFSYRVMISKETNMNIVYFIVVTCLGVLIQLRIHGAFAMGTLVLLTPASFIFGFYCLMLKADKRPISKTNSYQLIAFSILITLITISSISGWTIKHINTRSIVYWDWLDNLSISSSFQPASYIFKAPISRPESLAVISLFCGISFLYLYKNNYFQEISITRKSFALLSSIFSLSILVSYLVPPFSNLFININGSEAAATHYRLMWSSEIFSPLPLIINEATNNYGYRVRRILFISLTTIVSFIVLVPIPHIDKSSDSPQFLWSKSRQLFEGPSEQADQSKVVSAILPTIIDKMRSNKKQTFLADNIINFSLSPYSNLVQPLYPPKRIFKLTDLEYSATDYISNPFGEKEQIDWLKNFQSKPDWIVQQILVGKYYSPYAEIRVYDPNIVDAISKEVVNRISADVLNSMGYKLVEMNNSNYKIWQKVD